MMKLLTATLVLLTIPMLSLTQTHVNREWVETFGEPLDLEWSKTINGIDNQLIHVGNIATPTEGANISTTVYYNDGTIKWQSNFHSQNQNNDYGISVTFDQDENVYVLGTTDNETTTNHDLLLLKYSSTGSLEWSETYNSSYNLNDIGTELIVDELGEAIYICASSESSTDDYDFLTLKYNSGGVLQWDERYDYNSLVEIPVGIEFGENDDIFITGASGSATDRWDYTIVNYLTDGTYLGDERNAMPGIGFDQPLAFAKDSADNIFVTGRSSTDGVNYDIKTIKMDESYNLEWSKIYDFEGKEDAGSTVRVDTNGNVYVGGFVTRVDDVKDMILIKYDSTGNLLFDHNMAGENSSEDAFIKFSDISTDGDFYFLGQEKNKDGKKQCVLSKMQSDGTKSWLKKIKGSVNKLPVGVNLAPNGSIYATVVNEGIDYENEVIKYTYFEQGSNVILNDTAAPVCKDNELIIRFKHDALNKNAIDNNIGDRVVEYESLDYFLNPTAMNEFNKAMKKLCESDGHEDANPCSVKAVKMFKQLKTTDTATVSRMGETIKIPDFWTTLLLVFPEHVNIPQAYTILNDTPEIIAYAEPNLFTKTTSAPNDYYYASGDQHSLFSTTYPDAHINMEEAWEVFPEAGLEHIKCGVFDTGVNFKHEDFGYDGSNPASSKVRDGWDFEYNQSLYTTTVPDYGHGTPCAGIIGAIRNNTTGVAGIAGGEYQGSNDFSDKGVSLYSLKIMNFDSLAGNPIQTVYDAIVSSAIDDTLDYTYGLNIASNSWRIQEASPNWYTDTNLTLIKEATRFANRAKVSFVAARGNEGNTKQAYPATIDDDWIFSVGGSGNNGLRKTKFNGFPQLGGSSSYGLEMDVIAPAAKELITTTGNQPLSNGAWYQSFSMTSAATPHVAGTVALLQSYLNDSIPAYKNLAPEDCEHIIELTAVQKDTTVIGYSDETGWGLTDAGAAFRLIEQPWNTVHHFGSNVTTPNSKGYTTEALTSTIELEEQVQNYVNEWFDEGQYDVNIYRYDATVYHGSEIDSIDTIVAYWARPSSSEVLEAVFNDTLLPRERVQIDYLDRDSCKMHGYVYEVLDNSGNSLGWLPEDTLTLRPNLEYTVLTRDSTAPVAALDKNHVSNQKINLYPNPTSGTHTLVLSGFKQNKTKVNLYNIQGKKLNTIHDGILPKEPTFQVDVSHLNRGVYYYVISSGEVRKTIRFIKK